MSSIFLENYAGGLGKISGFTRRPKLSHPAFRHRVYYERKSIFKSEKELQEYLYSNWKKIPFLEAWNLQRSGWLDDGQYNTQEIGEIDFLAKHFVENRWLVIELKRDRASDVAVGQILRYMGWVKKKLAGENGKVEGLIIAGSADDHMRYALELTPHVECKVYHLENGQLVFKDEKEAYLAMQLERLCPDPDKRPTIKKIDR